MSHDLDGFRRFVAGRGLTVSDADLAAALESAERERRPPAPVAPVVSVDLAPLKTAIDELKAAMLDKEYPAPVVNVAPAPVTVHVQKEPRKVRKIMQFSDGRTATVTEETE